MGSCVSNDKHKMQKTDRKGNKQISSSQIDILYVEDTEIYVAVMKYIFQQIITNRTVNFIWRKTNNEAYNYIRNNHVDWIFLDRQLQNEMGDDLISRILETNLFDTRKIIVISCLDDLQEVRSFTKRGMHYFQKPLDLKGFKTKILKILN